jgi:hypothetical protein
MIKSSENIVRNFEIFILYHYKLLFVLLILCHSKILNIISSSILTMEKRYNSNSYLMSCPSKKGHSFIED